MRTQLRCVRLDEHSRLPERRLGIQPSNRHGINAPFERPLTALTPRGSSLNLPCQSNPITVQFYRGPWLITQVRPADAILHAHDVPTTPAITNNVVAESPDGNRAKRHRQAYCMLRVVKRCQASLGWERRHRRALSKERRKAWATSMCCGHQRRVVVLLRQKMSHDNAVTMARIAHRGSLTIGFLSVSLWESGEKKADDKRV